MRIQLGTRLRAAPGPKYRSRLRFAEFDFVGGLPKPAKLRDWCQPDEKGAFVASLIAPTDQLFDERGRPHAKENRSVFDRLCSASEALGASFIVLETGSQLSPSLRDRDRFFSYCDTLKASPGCPQLVWRAGGLWEPEEVITICDERQWLAAVDPFSEDLPDRGQLYLQARAEGGTRRFGEDHFVRLVKKLEACSQVETITMTLDSERSFREVGRLKDLLAEFELIAIDDGS